MSVAFFKTVTRQLRAADLCTAAYSEWSPMALCKCLDILSHAAFSVVGAAAHESALAYSGIMPVLSAMCGDKLRSDVAQWLFVVA